jgi:hypothetical protein
LLFDHKFIKFAQILYVLMLFFYLYLVL